MTDDKQVRATANKLVNDSETREFPNDKDVVVVSKAALADKLAAELNHQRRQAELDGAIEWLGWATGGIDNPSLKPGELNKIVQDRLTKLRAERSRLSGDCTCTKQHGYGWHDYSNDVADTNPDCPVHGEGK